MKLAPRLLMVASVTLLLPWAGCQYIREVESALRYGQAETLGATADVLASALTNRLDTGDAPGSVPGIANTSHIDNGTVAAPGVYAHPLNRSPSLDGYADDWGLPAAALLTLPEPLRDDFTVRYQLGTDGPSLFLFFQIDDDDVVTGAGGDRVRLRLGSADEGFIELLFAAQAPGALEPGTSQDDRARRIRGNWQATSTGYNLELQIPLRLAGDRLGFLISDTDQRGDLRRTGTLSSLAGDPGRLVTPLAEAQTILRGAVRPGQRLRLVDREGFVLANANGGPPTVGEQPLPQPLRRLVRWIVRDPAAAAPVPDLMPGRVDMQRIASAFQRGSSDARVGDTGADRVLLEAVRAVGADRALVLLAEEDAERILSLTDRAASRLFVSSFLISLAAVGLLLGFAAWLSWRIRRLSQAARVALGDEATRIPPLPEQRATDELGELSRNFSRLLEQIGEYNDYLQNLGSRLTHELRTPMAVIHTSLENLQAETGDERYLQRARHGMDRLQAMVTALGAATRMEQAIAATESERFDLARLLKELGEALQAAHRDRDLQLHIRPGPCPMTGAPDLVAQMVDKLIENALDFCPADGHIWISLTSDDDDWLLEVGNTGSRLPDAPSERLFESMTSVRRDDGPTPHLGLGLYIVRLIARHHGGHVHAETLAGDAGVRFRVRLPAADSAP